MKIEHLQEYESEIEKENIVDKWAITDDKTGYVLKVRANSEYKLDKSNIDEILLKKILESSLNDESIKLYFQYIFLLFQDTYLDTRVTEYAINECKGTFFILKNGVWTEIQNSYITKSNVELFSKYLSNITRKTFAGGSALVDTKDTIASQFSTAVPLTNDRFQVVSPPIVSDDKIVITMRKPNSSIIHYLDFEEMFYKSRIKRIQNEKQSSEDSLVNLYENTENLLKFLLECVKSSKNILIVGGTGSGKTTLMKSIMQTIPTEERIITIEDSPELVFAKHKNVINLFYESETRGAERKVTPSDLIRATLRMNPDRVLIQEIRGKEMYDFVNMVSTGHGGSITSLHASNSLEAIKRMALMIRQHENGVGLTQEQALNMVLDVVDVIVCISTRLKETNEYGNRLRTPTVERVVHDIYFKASQEEQVKERLFN